MVFRYYIINNCFKGEIYMSEPFIKRKLNREALDAFAIKFTDVQNPNSTKKIPYVTADGKTINFVPAAAILRRNSRI